MNNRRRAGIDLGSRQPMGAGVLLLPCQHVIKNQERPTTQCVLSRTRSPVPRPPRTPSSHRSTTSTQLQTRNHTDQNYHESQCQHQSPPLKCHGQTTTAPVGCFCGPQGALPSASPSNSTSGLSQSIGGGMPVAVFFLTRVFFRYRGSRRNMGISGPFNCR